jgi:hypothetical protein
VRAVADAATIETMVAFSPFGRCVVGRRVITIERTAIDTALACVGCQLKIREAIDVVMFVVIRVSAGYEKVAKRYRIIRISMNLERSKSRNENVCCGAQSQAWRKRVDR